MGRTRTDIRPRIVEAARARFLVEGVDGASLRAIASDAGTSIGMVYYYFKTKDDLFLGVVEQTYSRLLQDVTQAADPALTPLERIRQIYRRIDRIDEHESQVVRLVIREVLVSSTRLARLLERFARGHFPIVLQALADGMREGTIRADVPPMVLLPVLIGVGAIPQFMLGQLGKRDPALADLLVDVLYRGIRPPEGPRAGRAGRGRARAGTRQGSKR
jgi:AcrR family transcriptional regulator